MTRLLIAWLASCACAVENALHDSRGALGDAVPCCRYCDASRVPCPASMGDGASPVRMLWDEFAASISFAEGAVVTVPCGTLVVVDRSLKLGGLHVRGELAFADGSERAIVIETPFVHVCGVLSAGTQERHFASRLEIVLAGESALTSDGIEYGAKAMAVFGGLIFLRGSACADARVWDREQVVAGGPLRTTWARLAQSAFPGAVELELDADIVAGASQFYAGAQIVVASTDWDEGQSEERRVVEVKGDRVIVIDSPLLFAHSGVAPVAAEVMALSRNVVVRSEERCAEQQLGAKPRCGHFILSHTPHGVICGVEVTNMGAHTTLGKYPLHAHMCGQAFDLAFVANSVHACHHRSVVMHSTSDALVAYNVAYKTEGHMYVFENGLELRNAVVENVGARTRSPFPAWSCAGHACAGADGCSFGSDGDSIEACGSRDDVHAEIFWIANPQNDFLRNVAIGGVRSGFSVYPVLAGPMVRNPHEQRRGAGLDARLVKFLSVMSARDAPHSVVKAGLESVRLGAHALKRNPIIFYQNTSALHLEFALPGQFDGNVAHSTRIGFHAYPQWSPGGFGSRKPALWRNLVAYKISGAAFRAKTRCATFRGFVLDNLTVAAVSMVARARDVESRFGVANLDYVHVDDAAFQQGACMNRSSTTGAVKLDRCGRAHKRFAYSVVSRDVSTASSSATSERFAHCERCGPSNSLVSVAPGESGGFANVNEAHKTARHCELPYFAFNFDQRTIDSNLAEKCAIRTAEDGADPAAHLRSCYAARQAVVHAQQPKDAARARAGARSKNVSATDLNMTVAIDAASLRALEAFRRARQDEARGDLQSRCASERLVLGSFERASELDDLHRASTAERPAWHGKKRRSVGTGVRPQSGTRRSGGRRRLRSEPAAAAGTSLSLGLELPSCPWPAYCGSDRAQWRSVVTLRNQGEAGLRDRATALLHAHNVAASLCATLVFGAPETLLSAERHNYGVPVAADSEGWSKYLSFNWTAPASGATSHIAPRRDAVAVRSVSAEAVAGDYLSALAHARAGRTVQWSIEAKYHAWKKALQAAVDSRAHDSDAPLFAAGSAKTKGLQRCTWLTAQPSERASSCALKALHHAGLADHAWHSVHVRRGDELKLPQTMRANGLKVCNSTATNVANYVKCQLAPQDRDVPLLVFTDERDAAYLADLAAQLAPLAQRVVLGDAAVRAALPRADRDDNFLVYAAVDALIALSTRALRISRGHCDLDCTASNR